MSARSSGPDLHSAAVSVEERARPWTAAQPTATLPGLAAPRCATCERRPSRWPVAIALMYLGHGNGPTSTSGPSSSSVVATRSTASRSPQRAHRARAGDRLQTPLALAGLARHRPYLAVLALMYAPDRPAAARSARRGALELTRLSTGLEPKALLRRFGDGFANASLGSVPKAQAHMPRMPPDTSPTLRGASRAPPRWHSARRADAQPHSIGYSLRRSRRLTRPSNVWAAESCAADGSIEAGEAADGCSPNSAWAPRTRASALGRNR